MVHKGILQIDEIRLIARPYLQIATTALLTLGVLGGWAGSNWLTVLITFILMIATIIWIGRHARLHGSGPLHVYASALINLAATAVIVVITGGAQSPFWLFFLIGSITSAMSFHGRAGINLEILNSSIASLALLGPELLNWPLERSVVTLAGMEVSILLLSSLMIRRITTLILASREAVAESEERYRRLVDQARDVIFTTSTDGKITSLNPAFEIFMGWSRAVWLGRPFEELVNENDRGRAQDQFERILQGETLRALRLQMQTRSGEILVVEMNISPQYRGERVIGLLGIARDMTQEQRAEDALRASEQRFRSLIENSYDAIALTDAEGTLTYMSPSTRRILGYDPEELVGHPGLEQIHPDHQSSFLQELGDILQHPEKTVVVQYRIRHKDNSWRWVEAVVRNRLMDPDVQALVGNYRDITEHKQAEEKIRATERLLRNTLDTLPVFVGILTPEGIILDANWLPLETFGLHYDDIIGLPMYDVYPWSHSQQVQSQLREAIKRAAQGETVRYDLELPSPAGGSAFFSFWLAPIVGESGQVVYLVPSGLDITERKLTEERLRQSEESFSKAFSSSPAALMITRFVDGKYIAVNKAYTNIVGFDSSELLGHLTTEFNIYVHPGQRGEIIEQLLEDGRLYNYEATIRNHSGELRTVLASLERLRFNDEDCLLTTLVDISDRKQAEEKLQQQNLRLKVLREIDTAILAADSIENIVGAALDHVLELIECQRASMALFDWETREVLVFNVRAARETSIQKGTRAPLELFRGIVQTLSENKPAVVHEMTALPDLPPHYQTLINDGMRSMCALPLFSQSALIGSFTMYSEIPGFFNEEKINLGREVANQVAIAITQSRLVNELEERLHERETLITDLTAKNAELERFIYTVSHELKSPLVTMKGYLGYLEKDAISGNLERLKGDTQRISNAVERMKELLNDLLELSRIGRLMNPSEETPFEEVVREALEIVHGQLTAHGVTVHIQSDLPVVYGDRQRLTEILQNLLDNAAKYMGEQTNPLVEIGQQGEAEGQPVFFVRDNGIGIGPEYYERIFGLFNKLNPQSEGTGIGLALVKRIVEFHGGRIWVESEGVPGKGSTFYFTLPRW